MSGSFHYSATAADECKLQTGFRVEWFGSGEGYVALESLGHLFLQAIVQPFFELILRTLGHLEEADTSVAGSIRPGDLSLQFESDVNGRKDEAKLCPRVFGQFADGADGHAPLADIGGGRGQFLILWKYNSQGNLDRMPEVPAPFPHHEIERRVETARRMEGGQRLLEDEVGSKLKGLLGSGLSIQHGKGDRLRIALSLAQRLQQIDAILQVIAVNDDRIELALSEQIVAGFGPLANVDVDGNLLQRGPQHR